MTNTKKLVYKKCYTWIPKPPHRRTFHQRKFPPQRRQKRQSATTISFSTAQSENNQNNNYKPRSSREEFLNFNENKKSGFLRKL